MLRPGKAQSSASECVMAMPFCPQPKPSRGVRLRTKKAANVKASRELTALYREVYQRDHYRCVACKAHVEVNGLNELTRAHPHHIIRRSHASKDIKHTTGNICTLCPTCHSDETERRLWIRGNADKVLTITTTKPEVR